MKKLCWVLGFIGVISFMFCSTALAQGKMNWHGSGGWGKGGAYSRNYNVQTVETVSGEVVSVGQFSPKGKMSRGIHLTLKTEKETLDIHVGPSWYILNQDLKIEVKDQLTIKGSRVTQEGKQYLIAAEIKKGGDTLPLRDDNGIPLWAGWR